MLTLVVFVSGLKKAQIVNILTRVLVRRDSPRGRGLPLHLLTVPHLYRAVVGRSGEDGVLV